MKKFGQVLESAENLPLEEQESLVAILRLHDRLRTWVRLTVSLH